MFHFIRNDGKVVMNYRNINNQPAEVISSRVLSFKTAHQLTTMKIANFILLLSLGLLAAPVFAQGANVPDKGNPNGMSDQDYLLQREKILKRMKAANQKQSQQTPEQEGNVNGEPAHESTYGQGYGSRKDAKDAAENKPTIDVIKPERPERPHIERPGR